MSVAVESNPHTSISHAAVLFHLSRAGYPTLPLCLSLSFSLFTLSSLSLSLPPRVCTRVPHHPGPILGRFTSKLAPVPRANRPASYGPIQFNFENKQPPTATLVNLFGNTAIFRSRFGLRERERGRKRGRASSGLQSDGSSIY